MSAGCTAPANHIYSRLLLCGAARAGLTEIRPMPLYDYQCGSCSHQMEVLQKISAAPLTDCPACQQPELKKVLSAPGFRLSGKGWYETDFKTGTKKNLAGSGD